MKLEAKIQTKRNTTFRENVNAINVFTDVMEIGVKRTEWGEKSYCRTIL